MATRLKNTLDYLHSNNINTLAFIDSVYNDKWDTKWLENFYWDINNYLDNKDKLNDDIKKLL